MKILAIEKEIPDIASEQFAPHLEREAAYIWKLYQNGVVREIYFREELTSAVLVLECGGVEEAREMLDELPLVQAGLIDFDIIPLKPYPGFARLFKSTDGENSI